MHLFKNTRFGGVGRVFVLATLLICLVGTVSAQEVSSEVYLPMNDSSAPLQDFSGNGNDASLVEGSPTYGVSGAEGDAVGFNGGEIFDLGDVYNGDSGDKSIAGWVEFDDVSQRKIVYSDGYLAMGIICGAGDGEFTVRSLGSDYPCPFKTAKPSGLISVQPDTEYHIAFTLDVSEDNMTAYLNGDYYSSVSMEATEYGDYNNDYKIGASINYDRHHIGWSDELYSANRVFSSSEVEDLYQLNDAPVFDSVSTEPSSWTLNSDVNVSADVVDSDGTVESVSADVYEDGTQIVSDASLSDSDGDGTWEIDNLFSVDQSDVYYNYTLTATDDDGATATYSDSQFIQNQPPKFSIKDLENKTYFKYENNWTVEVEKDGDNVLNEDITCEIFDDGNLTDSFTVTEGSNDNVETGSVTHDIGSFNFTASCSDPAGNTQNKTINYSVKAFEVQDTVFQDTVFETEENVYSVEVKTGGMVNESNVSLEYGVDSVQSSFSSNGISIHQADLAYRPRLVSSGSESRSFSFVFDYVRETANNTFVEEQSTSQSLSQTVEKAFSTDGISLDMDFGQSSSTVERHPFDVGLELNDSGVSRSDVSLSGESSFNDSTKQGFSSSFTPGFVDGSKSKDVSGSLFVQFKNDQVERNYSNVSVNVDEVVLNQNSNGQKVLQLDFFEEEDMDNSVKASYEYNFYTSTFAGVLDKNFGFSGNSTSTSLYLQPSYAEVLVSGPILYDSSGFRGREYRVSNQSLGGSSIQQDLFLIDETVGEPTYFTVTDQAGDPVSGILQIMRYDGETDELTTVSRRKIDDEGETLDYLNIDDVYYGYRIEQDGEIIREFEESLITCSTVPCESFLQVDEGQLPYFSNLQGFQYSCGPTQDSDGNFSGIECSIDHENDLMDSASLTVSKSQGLYDENVCETNTSSPGTLSCSVSSYQDYEVSYVLKGSTDGFEYVLKQDSVDFSTSTFEEATPMMASIVFLMISFIGLRNYGTAIMFSVAGAVASYAFGLYTVSISAIGGLVFVGVILLFMNKQGR